MAPENIVHREPRTLDTRKLNTTLFRLRYGDLCLPIDCSYLEDYLQQNCSLLYLTFNNNQKITLSHWNSNHQSSGRKP